MEWVKRINENAIEMVDLSFRIGFDIPEYIFLPAKKEFNMDDYLIYDGIAIKRTSGLLFKYVISFIEGKYSDIAIAVEDRHVYSGGLGREINFSIGTMFFPWIVVINKQIRRLEKILAENQPGYTGLGVIEMIMDNGKEYYYGLSFHSSGVIHDMYSMSSSVERKNEIYISGCRFYADEAYESDDIVICSDPIGYYAICMDKKFAMSWNRLYDYLFKYRKKYIFRIDGKSALKNRFVGIINFFRREQKRREKKRERF